MSGAVVLVTLFAATSQALNLLIPDTGLLHAVFAIFIFCQLLTIGAARSDRIGSLRSVVVLFGSLFVLRFILLEGLYARSGSTLNRVLQTLISGATLGGIAYQPNAPATGYVAFLTLALFIVGLLLLPHESTLATGAPRHRSADGDHPVHGADRARRRPAGVLRLPQAGARRPRQATRRLRP